MRQEKIGQEMELQWEYNHNRQAYNKKYNQQGYGLQHPDGHIIRFRKIVLEYELGWENGQGIMLDYGCGNGVHSKYFSDLGTIVYGCDISKEAIEECKQRLKLTKKNKNFWVCEPTPNLIKYFNDLHKKEHTLESMIGKFDLILCNQVLYYLKDRDIKELVRQFYGLLRPNGVLYASMMSRTNHYFNLAQETEPWKKESLLKVELKGRLNETTLINFKDEHELEPLFQPFRRLHVGWYGERLLEHEGNRVHVFFIGVKD